MTNAGKALPFFLNAPRVDGALTCISPTMAGIQVAGQITDANASYDRFHGLKLQYADGPPYAALTHQWNTSRITDDSVNQSTTLSANYNFGVVKYGATGANSQTLGKFALAARYGLSKSTFLYTSASVAAGDLKDYIAQRTAMQLGMRTAF